MPQWGGIWTIIFVISGEEEKAAGAQLKLT